MSWWDKSAIHMLEGSFFSCCQIFVNTHSLLNVPQITICAILRWQSSGETQMHKDIWDVPGIHIGFKSLPGDLCYLPALCKYANHFLHFRWKNCRVCRCRFKFYIIIFSPTAFWNIKSFANRLQIYRVNYKEKWKLTQCFIYLK